MKYLKLYSKLTLLPLLFTGLMMVSSCSKKGDSANSVELTKKIIGNYPSTSGPIQIPTKISSYAGPCIASGGWCVDMPIPGGETDPLLPGYALSTLGYNADDPGNMLIYFDQYYEGDNMEGVNDYTVEADQVLPPETSIQLTGFPNTTVLAGTYPLGTSAEGNQYVIVSIVSE